MRNAPEEENARTHTHTSQRKILSLKTKENFFSFFFLFSHPFFYSFFFHFFLSLGFYEEEEKKKEIKKIHEGKKNRKNFLSLLQTPSSSSTTNHLIADNALLFERVGASFGGGLRDDEDGERERDINSN